MATKPSLLSKFFYHTLCTRCTSESMRINKAINQQIARDLLYAYDPLQRGVGKEMNYCLVIV